MKKTFLMIAVLLSSFATNLSAQNSVVLDLKGFTGVDNNLPVTVNIYQASNFKVEVVAPQDVVDNLKITVEDGMLRLKNKDNFWGWNNKLNNVVINVWAPSFNAFYLNGSGDMITKTAIKSTDFKVKLNGSGSIKITDFQTNSLTVQSNGSGDVYLSGNVPVDEAEFDLNGSGDIDSENLSCKKVEAHINGSGDIKVWAVSEFAGKIVGSGDITIKGSPTIDAKVVGSGKIRRNN